MRRLAVLSILSALALAGCVAPGAGLDPNAAPSLPAAYLYRCAGGDASSEPCADVLKDLRTAYQEPYAAADGTRPGVFAVGVNAGPSPIDQALAAPEGRSAICQNDILLTEDGGATWRYVETPRPRLARSTVSYYCGGDPALAFDAAGVLHHSGIATDGVYQGNGYEIYYTRSADLGETWSDPVVLSINDEEDRNWIGIDDAGRLYVVWQFFGGDGGSAVALSEDGGDTWDTFLPDEGRACFTTSPPVFDGDTMLFACSTYAAEEPTVRVVAFDPATRAFGTRADLDSGDGFAIWPKLAWSSGRLALLVDVYTNEGGGSVLAWSDDSGRAWTPFEDARPLLPDGMPEGAFRVQWATTDPWGRMHVVWRSQSAARAAFFGVPVESAFAHSVVGADGAALQKARVSAGERLIEPAPPETLGQRLGNHYMGLAFNGDVGLLVWSERGVLEYAIVEAGLPAPEGSS